MLTYIGDKVSKGRGYEAAVTEQDLCELSLENAAMIWKRFTAKLKGTIIRAI